MTGDQMAAQSPTEAPRSDPQFMQSLARGLRVLEAFSRLGPRANVPQLAEETGLARAVVTRCLHTLACLGYIEEQERRYMVRPQALRLAEAYLANRSLPVLAQPVLEDLRNLLGESCSLGVLDGDDIVYVARASTVGIMTISLHVGSRLPAHGTSMGRVLIAALPPSQRNAMLANARLDQRTAYSIVDRNALTRAIEAVAAQGYALIDQELELGLRSIAVPVRNSHGDVVAALNLGANAMRLSIADMETRVLERLREAAVALGRLAS